MARRDVSIFLGGGVYGAPATVQATCAALSLTQGTPTVDAPAFADDFEAYADGTAVNAAATGVYGWNAGGTPTKCLVATATSYAGSKSLSFLFGPDASGAYSRAEQRLQLGAYLTEIWTEHWWLVPSNYKHRADGYLGSVNNKFWTFWKDTYSDPPDCRPRIEIERTDDDTSVLRPCCTMPSVWPDGQTGTIPLANVVVGSRYPTIISASGPVTKGTWAQVRVHFLAATSTATANGVFEVWINGTKIYRAEGDFIGIGSDRTLHNGYLMGEANSGYALATTFYADGVKVYATNPGW